MVYDYNYEEKLEAAIELYKAWMNKRKKIIEVVLEMIEKGKIKYKKGDKTVMKKIDDAISTIVETCTVNEGYVHIHSEVNKNQAERIADKIADMVKRGELKYNEKTDEFEIGDGEPEYEAYGW